MKTKISTLLFALLMSFTAFAGPRPTYLLPEGVEGNKGNIPLMSPTLIRSTCDMLVILPEGKYEKTWTDVVMSLNTHTSKWITGQKIEHQDLKDVEYAVERLYIVLGKGIEDSSAAKTFFQGKPLQEIRDSLKTLDRFLKQLRKDLTESAVK